MASVLHIVKILHVETSQFYNKHSLVPSRPCSQSHEGTLVTLVWPRKCALLKCNHTCKNTIEVDREPTPVSSEINLVYSSLLMVYHNPSWPICTKTVPKSCCSDFPPKMCRVCTETASIVKHLSNEKRNRLQLLPLPIMAFIVVFY